MIYYLLKCIFGPNLYRIYRNHQTIGKNYHQNSLEFYSNSFIELFHGICLVCKWTSPVLFAYAYYKGYLTNEYLITLTKVSTLFGSFLLIALILRGVGRNANTDYRRFIEEFIKLHNNTELTSERRSFLFKYDFSMKNWAPDFVAPIKHPIFKGETYPEAQTTVEQIKLYLWRPISYLCVNTFGLRMMYPGLIVQSLIRPALIDGRAKIIEIKRAIRGIVYTNNHKCALDTVFVDQRGTLLRHGKYLVICCDGNAAFYEVGIFSIAVDKGYSTLGWNYPGFGESRGLPYPEDVTSSVDAVMQYAFKLGFKQEDIILFSWSIGGFPAAWVATYYPEIKAVILDACFDNVIHLAKQQMPQFATELVEYAIKTNLNLDILQILKRYQGPIRLIRRTKDEIVSTIPGKPSSNRGNELLIGILKHRYKNIITDNCVILIRKWLSVRSEAERMHIYTENVNKNKDLIEAIIKRYLEEQNRKLNYPIDFGNEINEELRVPFGLYLASKYLDNYDSVHCQALPMEYIQDPWSELNVLSNNKNQSENFNLN